MIKFYTLSTKNCNNCVLEIIAVTSKQNDVEVDGIKKEIGFIRLYCQNMKARQRVEAVIDDLK